MNYVYLVRHGESYTPEQNRERPLNEQGKIDIRLLADELSKKNVKIDAIYHSNKLRSKQTADILASILTPANAVVAIPALDPEESINQLSYEIENLKENALLVGHLPNLEILTAYLLNLGTSTLGFAFAPGAVACLKHDGDKYTLEWFISPAEGNGML